MCCFPCVLMACLHEMLTEHMENNTFEIQHVVFLVFWYEFMQTCYQNIRKTTHCKPNVSQTNVITMFCVEMLSEQMENNTFQSQRTRNQWNNNNFSLPGYFRQIFWHTPPKKTKCDGHHVFFSLIFYVFHIPRTSKIPLKRCTVIQNRRCRPLLKNRPEAEKEPSHDLPQGTQKPKKHLKIKLKTPTGSAHRKNQEKLQKIASGSL